jgi:hypothetical protein
MSNKKRMLLNRLSGNYTLRNQINAKAEYLRVEQGICGFLYQIQYEQDAKRFVRLYLEQREAVLEAREHGHVPTPMPAPIYEPTHTTSATLLGNGLYADLMLIYIALVRDMGSTVAAMQLTYDSAYTSIASVFHQHNIQFLPDATGTSMNVSQATTLLLDMAYRNIVNKLFIEHIRPHIGRQTSHKQIDALLPRQLISDNIGSLIEQFKSQHDHRMSGTSDAFYQQLGTPLRPFCCDTIHHCAQEHIKMLKLDNVVSKIKAINDKPMDLPRVPKLDDCFKNPAAHAAYRRDEEEETLYETPRPDNL